jgi:hypothetical protein
LPNRWTCRSCGALDWEHETYVQRRLTRVTNGRPSEERVLNGRTPYAPLSRSSHHASASFASGRVLGFQTPRSPGILAALRSQWPDYSGARTQHCSSPWRGWISHAPPTTRIGRLATASSADPACCSYGMSVGVCGWVARERDDRGYHLGGFQRFGGVHLVIPSGGSTAVPQARCMPSLRQRHAPAMHRTSGQGRRRGGRRRLTAARSTRAQGGLLAHSRRTRSISGGGRPARATRLRRIST